MMCFFLLLAARPLMAQPTGPEVRMLVFDEETHFDYIVHNVAERLVGVPIQFRVQRISVSTSSEDGRFAIASQVIDDENVALVFYLEPDADDPRVLYLLRAGNNRTTLTRHLEGTGELSLGDAVALITLTTVELLLDTGALPHPLPPPSTAPVVQPVPPPSLPSATPPRLFADAAYRLHIASSAPDLAHGARVRASFRFWRPLRVYLAAGITSPLSSSENGVTVTRTSWPFSAGLALMGRAGTLSIGGSVGAVFSATSRKVASSPQYETVGDSSAFGLAVEIEGSIEWAVASRVALFAGPSLLINAPRTVYQIDGGPRLFDEYYRIQPGFTVGVQFFAF